MPGKSRKNVEHHYDIGGARGEKLYDIFLDKNLEMLYIIPLAIIVAFSAKGASLYLARVTTINVGLNVTRDLQQEMAESILKSDIHKIEEKHSAKFISNFLFDTTL